MRDDARVDAMRETGGTLPRQGRFLTFEGGEGAGKSTQISRLKERLNAAGIEAVVTREPGGSPTAETIRELLLSGKVKPLGAEIEAVMFAAARADHVDETIRPALNAGRWVLCDRFADSTRVYQGVGRADLRPVVDELHALMIAREPDLTLLIDIGPREGLARAAERGGGEARFEDFGEGLQNRLRAGFLALAEEFPDRVAVIDGARPPEAVAVDVARAVEARLA